MSKPKVIIVGGGIAGPVLAVFLKMKGYDPVVYERLTGVNDVGLSLCLAPNGLRVLALIPGFLDTIREVSDQFAKMLFCSALAGDERVLAENDMPAQIAREYGEGIVGIQRSDFHRVITTVAERYGVQTMWGHKLVSATQDSAGVEVVFENGHRDTASFVVGCDGLHSVMRACLFGQEEVQFTGLTQCGGESPTPSYLAGSSVMMNVYGDGAHVISHPISNTVTSWAVTAREPEARETWRTMDEEKQKEFKAGPWSQWDFGVKELVRTSGNVVKFGLYDRPELETWHKDRVVLLGDAAHPTSPHLGQGANQSFEDVYHLVRFLAKYNPSAGIPSAEVLQHVFSDYEAERIPRTSMLVKGAREAGNIRVVNGVDACMKRNAVVEEMWKNVEAIFEKSKAIYTAPYLGKSDI